MGGKQTLAIAQDGSEAPYHSHWQGASAERAAADAKEEIDFSIDFSGAIISSKHLSWSAICNPIDVSARGGPDHPLQ